MNWPLIIGVAQLCGGGALMIGGVNVAARAYLARSRSAAGAPTRPILLGLAAVTLGGVMLATWEWSVGLVS